MEKLGTGSRRGKAARRWKWLGAQERRFERKQNAHTESYRAPTRGKFFVFKK